ncbi:hypothetical protein [Hydrogenophaga sp. BPS33]|uniref:hypothetical protein n=1 Tax=Hydrogenophaga sp. BPS33 TaxID=2651974 RepID=UPI0013200E43|nr:hypothetical protein [Hydrogenophaga sp. BPS33]QHE89233.1 hypothetical protein F9K07_30065 [Hydrogenophaga sp. BPS33]
MIATIWGISTETGITMAKVVNIHLLVNSNKTAQIANRLNDALRNIVSPMGGGSAQGSFVLDYHLADLEGARPASKDVQLAIAKGRYKKGSAFQRRGVRRAYIDHYLLHINEDVEPDLMGAFGSEDAMLKAANCLHESHPDDGMYHMTCPPPAVPG